MDIILCPIRHQKCINEDKTKAAEHHEYNVDTLMELCYYLIIISYGVCVCVYGKVPKCINIYLRIRPKKLTEMIFLFIIFKLSSPAPGDLFMTLLKASTYFMINKVCLYCLKGK